MYRELLIGAGSNHNKKLWVTGQTREWSNLTTLDYNAAHKPDVVYDLMGCELPFPADTFDEIHAYDVLEHTGAQGDWRFFFRQWTDFYRVLKPGGLFFGISPMHNSVWAFGDPSHTRTVQLENLTFLSQAEYTKQVGNTPLSDFRFVFKGDFDLVWYDQGKDVFSFVIKAIKPSRINGG